MKYQVYRQFTERIWEEPQTFEDLSTYLSEHQIRNIVDGSDVKGQVDDLELKVTFGPTWAGASRKVNTEMRGTITTSNLDDNSQRRATEVLTLLAQYMPKHLKE